MSTHQASSLLPIYGEVPVLPIYGEVARSAGRAAGGWGEADRINSVLPACGAIVALVVGWTWASIIPARLLAAREGA